MTAPELVEVVAGALFEVRDDAFDEDTWEEIDGTDREEYECQARAVLAALTEAGTVEWGVQGKTFVDEDWDRVWTKNVNGQPFTEDDARNHLWLKSPIPFRLVSRLTLPWGRVE